jgi:hypothetical protein
MSGQDMEGAVERSEGTPVRDAVESAYASHTPSPDIDLIVGGAREDHAREKGRGITTSMRAIARTGCATCFAEVCMRKSSKSQQDRRNQPNPTKRRQGHQARGISMPRQPGTVFRGKPG